MGRDERERRAAEAGPVGPGWPIRAWSGWR